MVVYPYICQYVHSDRVNERCLCETHLFYFYLLYRDVIHIGVIRGVHYFFRVSVILTIFQIAQERFIFSLGNLVL